MPGTCGSSSRRLSAPSTTPPRRRRRRHRQRARTPRPPTRTSPPSLSSLGSSGSCTWRPESPSCRASVASRAEFGPSRASAGSSKRCSVLWFDVTTTTRTFRPLPSRPRRPSSPGGSLGHSSSLRTSLSQRPKAPGSPYPVSPRLTRPRTSPWPTCMTRTASSLALLRCR